MRCLRLFLDDPRLGTGFHVLFEIRQGRALSHLLHLPSLSHLELPLRAIEEQLRAGAGREVPVSRGLVGRLLLQRRAFDHYRFRYPAAFVREALDAARAWRAAGRG